MANNQALPITIQGTLESITFANEEDHYVVARLEVPGRKEPITIVGNLISIRPGETLRLNGRWVSHKKYGKQFQVESYQTLGPATLEGIERYLSSAFIKGIGPHLAKSLVEKFGMDTLRVIEEEPSRLMEVEGIGRVRLKRITRAWEEQRGNREVMLFLQSHGVSPAYAIKIFKAYGPQAISIVKEDPYRLAQDIYGIGFQTADRIAQNLGIKKDSPVRARAGVLYVLHRLAEEGHVYFPYSSILRECNRTLEVDTRILSQAMEPLCREGKIVMEEHPGEEIAVYLKALYQAEEGIARRLSSLARAPRIDLSLDTDKAIALAEKVNGISLAGEQREAIRKALSEKVLVITGGPGTGKTTILRSIIQILEGKGCSILLCSPTGRAAKRMSEATGREAKTIHRLLEWSQKEGKFKRNERRPLEADLVIVDEASMVDLPLMDDLLKAIPFTASLILVGDADQLPSVGPGSVLKDIIRSGISPVIALREVFRQAQASLIIVNAHRVNQGVFPIIPRTADFGQRTSDFIFLQKEDPEEVRGAILELAHEALPRRFGLDPLEDIQVLTPMHKGIIGAASLNLDLQALLNPHGQEISRGSRRFRLGDRVMQIRNNYDKEVYNGDIGRIAWMDLEEQELAVRFDERLVSYDFSELDELTLAYTVTVHKSQGSEYPAVILPIHTHHYMMLQRNLLYTAIARAKHLVVLVGTKKALAIAVKNDRVRKRYSGLESKLKVKGGGL